MRSARRAVLVLAVAAFVFAEGLQAQQLPVTGCRAAASCAGPRGFSTLRQSSGEVNTLFSVGFSVADGRIAWRVVQPPRVDFDERAVHAAVDLFVRRTPLRRTDAGGQRAPEEPGDLESDPR